MKLFGEKIRDLRRNFKYTQKNIYDITGIHTDTIRRIEKGESIPSFDTFEKLSCLYSIDLYELLKKYVK